MNRITSLHDPVLRLAEEMRIPTEGVVRESKLERRDGLEFLNVLVREGDLESFDVVFEVFNLATTD